MNVLFVSQCTKRALTETRRVLDQFAERRGERTWQTPITQAGLDTVRRLLRQSARKNTAVACHWIRGLDHSELLWVVGDTRQFNAEGAVPTNTTARNVLRADDENCWHQLPLITALAALAALLHDLGKATQAFQDRLRGQGPAGRNLYRHEWVSVRLLQTFVDAGTDAAGDRSDREWLERLARAADADCDAAAFERTWRDGLIADGDGPSTIFTALPPLAQALAWLVLSHHRLPCRPVRHAESVDDEPDDDPTQPPRRAWRRFGAALKDLPPALLEHPLAYITPDWNEPREPADAAPYWRFAAALPVAGRAWRQQAARCARKLLALAPAQPPLDDPFAMHVSRLVLMLADHHYSSVKTDAERAPYRSEGATLYANTIKNDSAPRTAGAGCSPFLHQTLDEHLLGVHAHASRIAHALPTLATALPALRNSRALKRRSTHADFRWQDKAADAAAAMRERAAVQGAFIVNMASTGRGKTIANARVMYALADPVQGLRCAFAMGLRTLTRQTGASFRRDLALDDDGMVAIRVGGLASGELFDYQQRQAEASGSASAAPLLDEEAPVEFENDMHHPLLQRLGSDGNAQRLLAAPLLVCTIDHLVPATESLRGGGQIAPLLRLMTGDLVLDEPDDFDMNDLPALSRLVHAAGLMGARVLLSSATLAPALVRGLFDAYCEGRAAWQRHRGARPAEQPPVCCLWVDEFGTRQHDCGSSGAFTEQHEEFIKHRITHLQREPVRRRARIAPLPAGWPQMEKQQRRADFARLVLQEALALHATPGNHAVDAETGRRVSFGLVRMANIGPLYDVARALRLQGAPAGVQVHLCVYHSQFPQVMRSEVEHRLDTVLRRHPPADGTDPALAHPSVRASLAGSDAADHVFIVLASPVAEVGRDHDYDWAVVEPSSMRSLIQLAGRVRRHRPDAVSQANVVVLSSNLRACENRDDDKAAFRQPGFELDATHKSLHLKHHDVTALLQSRIDLTGAWPIDARPRIWWDTQGLRPRSSLIDLEHVRLYLAMKQADAATPLKDTAALHWHGPAATWRTGLAPQFQRFRDDTRRDTEVAFCVPDDFDPEIDLQPALVLRELLQIRERGRRTEHRVGAEDKCHRVDERHWSPSVSAWLQVDLVQALRAMAEDKGIDLPAAAERYATATLPRRDNGWWWHPALGFCAR